MRVVQLTLLSLAVVLAAMAQRAWRSYQAPGVDERLGSASGSLGEVVALSGFSALFAVGGALMGLRVVKGPEPPSLE